MKCYLHIGLEKTGTTTIQKFLDKNRQKLEQKGLYVPHHFCSTNLQCLGYLDPKLDDPYSQINAITDPASLKRFKSKVFARIQQEIRSHSQVIFSHELIQSRLTSQDEILELKSQLVKLGFKQIEIIIYLRDQAELFSSLCSQSLKNGLKEIEFFTPAPGNAYASFVCNHEQTLQWWGEVFGKDHLHVRLFEQESFIGGNLLDDFLSIFEFLPEEFILPQQTNQALNVLGVEVCRRLNQKMPWFDEFGKFNTKRAKMIPLINKHLCKSSDKFKIPKEVYQSYLDYYEDQNARVCSEFFPNRQRLFKQKDMDKYHENYELKGIDPKYFDDLVDFILGVSEIRILNYEVLKKLMRQLLYKCKNKILRR